MPVAPDAVFTVRTYATDRGYEVNLVLKCSRPRQPTRRSAHPPNLKINNFEPSQVPCDRVFAEPSGG
jgi:hypothetical protein